MTLSQKTIVIVFFFVLSFSNIPMIAQPPEPGKGMRWVLNEQFSDEFNGSSLDESIWYDYNPKWIGRPPAIFLPSQVSVSEGLLAIKNKKLDRDTIVNGNTFTIGGGAVASRNLLHFGYYECSMKASKIRMSSTFWMSSKSFNGPEPCDDKYSLEIDIQEAVGGFDNADSKFRHSMNSNSHYKYTPCGGVKTNYSVGGDTRLAEGEVSDTFVRYGAYWKNENEVDMYLNGRKAHSIRFSTRIHPEPFDQAMQMNMVTETYDWVRPLPTREDLNDDSRNTTYYDWVRSYKLVDIDAIDPDNIEWEVFEENIYFHQAANLILCSEKIDIQLGYLANRDLVIQLELFNHDSVLFGFTTHQVFAGYGLGSYNLELDSVPSAGDAFLRATLIDPGSGDSSIIALKDHAIELVKPVRLNIEIADSRDMQVISGATVTLGDSIKTSSAAGEVLFYNVYPGISGITVSKEGYETLSLQDLEFSSDTTLSLSLTPVSYHLVLDIYDAKIGVPLGGAVVKLGDQSASSNANGIVFFDVYEGTYDALIQMDNYFDNQLSYQIQSDSSIEVAMRKSHVDVKFVIQLDDARLSSAIIELGDESKTSSTIGIATFTEVLVDSSYTWRILNNEDVLLDSSLTIISDTTVRKNFYSTGGELDVKTRELVIYPNPARDQIHIMGSFQADSYKIISNNGVILDQGKLDSGRNIDISMLIPGGYVLELSNQRRFFFIKND